VKSRLAKIGSFGLAKSTWSSYRTAERQLLKCQSERKVDMRLPLTQEKTLIFIDWLINERKVKAATVNSYLSGVRQLHIERGIEQPEVRKAMINLVVKGKQNMDSIEARRKEVPGRLPVTLTIMRLLKACIRTWTASIDEKLLIWAVSTSAFHGSFRIHEILCKKETEFDPDFTLLWKDVTLTKCKEMTEDRERLSFNIKCPKEAKTGKSVVVDLFETKGETCPVRAFKKWMDKAERDKDKPVFMNKGKKPLTGRKLNSIIRNLLEKHIDYSKGKVSSHSFRAGMASLLAEKGFEEEEIKVAGRWNSRAFECYTKLPRTRREEISRKLGGI
jgi:integrase